VRASCSPLEQNASFPARTTSIRQLVLDRLLVSTTPIRAFRYNDATIIHFSCEHCFNCFGTVTLVYRMALFVYRRKTDKLDGGLQPVGIVSVPLPGFANLQAVVIYLSAIN